MYQCTAAKRGLQTSNAKPICGEAAAPLSDINAQTWDGLKQRLYSLILFLPQDNTRPYMYNIYAQPYFYA